MTVNSRYIAPVALVRSPKCYSLQAELERKEQPTGMDLAQFIFWGLEDRGITISDARRQKIIEACLEEC